MKYKLKYSTQFSKDIKKLDITIKKQIYNYLAEIIELDNPKLKGKPLMNNLKGLWRYRVNNYRIIVKINDNELTIIALKVGHRKEVYK